MKVIEQDLWSFVGECDAICITTNGYYRRGDGKAVMGRGCALEASTRYPSSAFRLGEALKSSGNIPHIIHEDPVLVSFPVKPAVLRYTPESKHLIIERLLIRFRLGDKVPGWACVADLNLIGSSARLLRQKANILGWSRVILPCPGIGFGERKWEDVEPILDKYLDDRFICVRRPRETGG